MNKSPKQENCLDFFSAIFYLLALLGLFFFPTFLNTSTSEPLPFLPEAWERYPFRVEPPRFGRYREYPK